MVTFRCLFAIESTIASTKGHPGHPVFVNPSRRTVRRPAEAAGAKAKSDARKIPSAAAENRDQSRILPPCVRTSDSGKKTLDGRAGQLMRRPRQGTINTYKVYHSLRRLSTRCPTRVNRRGARGGGRRVSEGRTLTGEPGLPPKGYTGLARSGYLGTLSRRGVRSAPREWLYASTPTLRISMALFSVFSFST